MEQRQYNNTTLVILSIVYFISNQLIEITIIHLFDFQHTNACIWDCGWYSSIVQNGYDPEPHAHPQRDAANWAFFPFVPLFAKGISLALQASPQTSLIITSKLFLLFSIFYFLKFGLAYYPKLSPHVLAATVAFNPYAIYANAGYTESVFLFFSSISLYTLSQRKWLTAGFLIGTLSSVRLVGIIAAFSYAIKLWIERSKKKIKINEHMALGLLLTPIGLALFMLWLYSTTGDTLAFSRIQIAWGRTLSNPVNTIINGVLSSDSLIRYYAITAIAALIATMFFLRKAPELTIFSLGCTLLPLAAGLQSMPRFIWWQAPFLLAISLIAARRWMFSIIFPFFITAQTFMYHAWYTGKSFVT